MGQLRHDAGEDDQRDAVADPPRGNLLAEPHQEYGAADQRNGGGNAEEPTWIEHDVASAFEADGDAIALQRGKNHRAVARVLVDLAPSLLAFLLQLLEMWRDRGQELNNDRCRDVRHDVERKDRHAPDRTARERIEHAEDAGLIPLKHLGERLRIDAGNWDVGAEPVDQQRAEREPDALLELVSRGKGREVEVGNELFCGRDHLDASLLSEKREGHWGPASRHSDLSVLAGLAFAFLVSPSSALGFPPSYLAFAAFGASTASGSSPLACLPPFASAWANAAARFAARFSALILSAAGFSRPVMDFRVTVPPLASTALTVLCDAPVTSKASLPLISPEPSRRTPSLAWRMRPASLSASTVIGLLPSSVPASI